MDADWGIVVPYVCKYIPYTYIFFDCYSITMNPKNWTSVVGALNTGAGNKYISAHHFCSVASGWHSWGHYLLDYLLVLLAPLIPLNMNNSNIATESSSHYIWQAQRKEAIKADKITKIAVICDIFSRVSFSSDLCRHAISRLTWGQDQKAFWGKRFCFFSWQGLFHFLMFQLPRTEHIGLKSNFLHHDNCTNVWWQMLEEKRGRWG